jgi:hypothetical protein
MMNRPFSPEKAKMLYQTSQLTDRSYGAIRRNMRSLTTSGLILGILTGVSACVQVSAPDKPIVINLNINIKQEVVYRLDGDAKDLINEEADIF